MQFEKILRDEPEIVPLDKKYQLIYFESTNIELNEFLINDSLKDQNELIRQNEYPKMYLDMYPIIDKI